MSVDDKKKRNKIAYCFKDYLKTLSDQERDLYLAEYAELAAIISSSVSDEEIMARARANDAQYGTDIFSVTVNFTIYCIACHRVDCIC